MQRHSFTALNSTFVVDSEYQFVKELGQGAYGCVVAARHRRSGEGCAIKKITNINTKVGLSISGSYANTNLDLSWHEAYPDKEMSERDQVCEAPRKSKLGFIYVLSDCSTISVDTKTYV